MKRELQGRVEELEDENDHLKRQQLIESEAKGKLRQESSRLTAENMVQWMERLIRVVCELICSFYQRWQQALPFFQDFEEQLDQKDRLIKKLQNQIKSLETSQKGNV